MQYIKFEKWSRYIGRKLMLLLTISNLSYVRFEKKPAKVVQTV